MITSEGSLWIACMAVVCWQIKPSLARARPSPLEGSLGCPTALPRSLCTALPLALLMCRESKLDASGVRELHKLHKPPMIPGILHHDASPAVCLKRELLWEAELHVCACFLSVFRVTTHGPKVTTDIWCVQSSPDCAYSSEALDSAPQQATHPHGSSFVACMHSSEVSKA